VTQAAAIGAVELLALEQIGERRFRAVHNLDNGRGANFGGQPLVQGLAAARRTVGGWPAHSVTGTFLRAGATALPVDYEVEAVRDGRRFAARRVLARQDGKPIFDMLCSFHDPGDGPGHQYGEAPSVPAPETLISLADFARTNADRLPPEMVALYTQPFPIELRLLDPEEILFAQRRTPRHDYWFRIPSAAGIGDPLDHQCLLAFLSDFWLAGTAGALHFRSSEITRIAVVTLNHSLWFHHPVRADQWLLYHTESPWTGNGRGLVRGLIYDESGRLTATTVQEVSVRPR
jgi:acyl-CoA thioesterase-2